RLGPDCTHSFFAKSAAAAGMQVRLLGLACLRRAQGLHAQKHAAPLTYEPVRPPGAPRPLARRCEPPRSWPDPALAPLAADGPSWLGLGRSVQAGTGPSPGRPERRDCR